MVSTHERRPPDHSLLQYQRRGTGAHEHVPRLRAPATPARAAGLLLARRRDRTDSRDGLRGRLSGLAELVESATSTLGPAAWATARHSARASSTGGNRLRRHLAVSRLASRCGGLRPAAYRVVGSDDVQGRYARGTGQRELL